MSISRKITEGAGAGGGSGETYVDDVFSAYLYEGTNANQDIVNGIDLDGEGGMVWFKNRTQAVNHWILDTERGVNKALLTASTVAEATEPEALSSFNNNGFSIKSAGELNNANQDICSWTFRKAPKFFDVVTWVGDGVQGREIPHNLGVEPGMIIVKRLTGGDNWQVFHKDLSNPLTMKLFLNMDLGEQTQSNPNPQFPAMPTDTVFTIGSDSAMNSVSEEYVAYIFAHDESEESMIQCGSFVPSSTWGSVIDLGWEPQWLMYKNADGSGDWIIHDTMRGIVTGGADPALYPNKTDAEVTYTTNIDLHPNGFEQTFSSGDTEEYIYMAIRRPNKPAEEFEPEELFAMDTGTGLGTTSKPSYLSGFPVDFTLYTTPTATSGRNAFARLTGNSTLDIHSTAAEYVNSPDYSLKSNNGFYIGGIPTGPQAWMWRRAPGFMDVVTYTGVDTNNTQITHNLGVVPEMIWVKSRSNVQQWNVLTYDGTTGKQLRLDANNSGSSPFGQVWGDGSNFVPPTSSVFTIGDYSNINTSGATYIAYLFASVPGLCDIGSYTADYTETTIDCGFTNGARFVLIKRTDAVGNWMLFDTLRGITGLGTDSPFLSLNTTDPQDNADHLHPASVGFALRAGSNLTNIDGAEYIYMAIA